MCCFWRLRRPVSALLVLVWGGVASGQLLDRSDLERLDLKPYWQAQVPLDRADLVSRAGLLDENLYLLTAQNRVYCVHAGTGIIRWSAEVAPPGSTVLGPTHSGGFAVFTTPTSIRLLSRRDGRPVGEARALRGVVVEVRGDIADISLGSLHGVRPGTLLDVSRREPGVPSDGKALARFRADTVHDRETTGRFVELDPGNRPQPGDQVSADVLLPLAEVAVPFSPSCAAVADAERVYYGGANQRFYALSIIGGYRKWEVMTPRTVTATPVLHEGMLYLAGQDGTVRAIDTRTHSATWTFRTEGPVFARPVVTKDAVYVSGSDRSLYAIDRTSGRKRWRTRFDAELLEPAFVDGTNVYQYLGQAGLVALDARTGEERWRYAEGSAVLARIGEDVYVVIGAGGIEGRDAAPAGIARLESGEGRPRGMLALSGVDFVAGSMEPTAILVADRLGRVMCARSASAAHLKPSELAEVLRNDEARAAAAEAQARLDAERKAKKPAPAAGVDPFASRSTAPPAVGTGLVPPTAPGAEPAEPATQEAEVGAAEQDEEEESPAEEGEDEDEAGDESEDE